MYDYAPSTAHVDSASTAIHNISSQCRVLKGTRMESHADTSHIGSELTSMWAACRESSPLQLQPSSS